MAVGLVTDENFQNILNTKDKIIVKYFADWCGSCRLFAPKYKRLSGDHRFSEITFLDVNAEKNPESRKAAGVTNLPYFAIFKNGELRGSICASKEDAVVALLEKFSE
jgi:thioredoxin 1